MSIKDIMAIVLEAEADAPTLAAARELASVFAGRARALMIEVTPDPVYVPHGYAMGHMWGSLAEAAHTAFVAERKKVEHLIASEGESVALTSLSVQAGFAEERAAAEARAADIVVIGRPEDGGIGKKLFEGALFGSGRPVLLIPPDWKRTRIGQKVVIGWNARREAARAVAAASPFLDRAREIAIVTVDAKPSGAGHGGAPGADLAAHLARRGQRAEVRNADGLGRTEGRAILDECAALDADLLVIGGYGRSRLQQRVFGGVTSGILAEACLPVLLAH